MAISTRLTQRLGITHPIISAPMDVIAGGKLAAAVTGAGGLGFLGGGYSDDGGWFATRVRRRRQPGRGLRLHHLGPAAASARAGRGDRPQAQGDLPVLRRSRALCRPHQGRRHPRILPTADARRRRARHRLRRRRDRRPGHGGRRPRRHAGNAHPRARDRGPDRQTGAADAALRRGRHRRSAAAWRRRSCSGRTGSWSAPGSGHPRRRWCIPTCTPQPWPPAVTTPCDRACSTLCAGAPGRRATRGACWRTIWSREWFGREAELREARDEQVARYGAGRQGRRCQRGRDHRRARPWG